MDKTYSPHEIEQSCYDTWEHHHYSRPLGDGEPYCIMLPPPNVTGDLHMGHGFQHTLMDVLIRYHRMMGAKVLWQPGTDHAGISTQLVVERQLEQEGLYKKELGREAFLAKVWEWKEQSGGNITKQMRRIGSSVDWSRERFTMDEGLSSAVLKVFVQLYEEGLIYRSARLVNWDPKLGTALSDLEVLSQEEAGFLWHIRYPLVGEQGEALVVATTRPETLFGDVAVAVHPEDSRFSAWIGKEVELPFCGRTIPVIADTFVEKEFGSGCVKITPAHDFQDHEVAKRHGLTPINIFTRKARINRNAPIAYQGMDRLVAREQLVQDLQEADLLVRVQPHTVKIPRGEKSGAIIEPLLTDQWYVKTKPLAEPAIEVVRKGQIRFVPESWTKTYYQWMENIEDWCISRQLWWGHRIPAWYDNQGRVYVGLNEEEVRKKHNIPLSCSLQQDEDVLDTWFSSALWPFSTLGWPIKNKELECFYPTSVLLTGFDIIFFWVARMIMMGLKFTQQIPFKEVIVTGLIRDGEGQKMSKSKGNVLDPIDLIDGISKEKLIEKRTENLLHPSQREVVKKRTAKEFPEGIPAFGTDALRFSFCALATMGRNVRFDLGRVEGYRNFCNKLWNAARFVLLHTEEESGDLGDGAFQYSPADQWILSLLQGVIAESHRCLRIYRFDLLAQTLYEFVWHEYCDWYLELCKPILYAEEALAAMKRGTRRTLIHVLDQILKLLHPIMPFITEKIWQLTNGFTSQQHESIMISSYPVVNEKFIMPEIEEELRWVKDISQALRTLRSEMNISPAKGICLYIKNANAKDKMYLEKYQSTVISLSKLISCEVMDDESIPLCASLIVNHLELLIPMADLIDKKAELLRVEKELAKLSKDISLAEVKLNNVAFTDKAPQDVIEKERKKHQEASIAMEKLRQHQKMLIQL